MTKRSTSKFIVGPLLALSAFLLFWFVGLQAQEPPLWTYFIWATYMLMQAGFSSRKPDNQITLRELLSIPALLVLISGVMAGAMHLVMGLWKLPAAVVVVVAIVVGAPLIWYLVRFMKSIYEAPIK